MQVPKGTVNYQEMFSVIRGKIASAGGGADEGIRAAIYADGSASFAGDITQGDSWPRRQMLILIQSRVSSKPPDKN